MDEWKLLDLGTGAGFYVDATTAPWSAAYRMYTYVTEELPALVEAELPAAKVWTDGESSPRHQTHFEPSYLLRVN